LKEMKHVKYCSVLAIIFILAACASPRQHRIPSHPHYSGSFTLCQNESPEIVTEECHELVGEACRVLQDDGLDRADEVLFSGIGQFPDCIPAKRMLLEVLYEKTEYQGMMRMIASTEFSRIYTRDLLDDMEFYSSAIESQWLENYRTDLARNDYEKALEAIHSKNEFFPFDEDHRLKEWNLLSELDRYDAVVEDVEKIDAGLMTFELFAAAGRAFNELDNYSQAVQMFNSALEIQHDPVVLNDFLKSKTRLMKLHFPPQLSSLSEEPWATREDLAAYLHWRFDLLAEVGFVPIITDIKESPSREAIEQVVAAGIMKTGRNRQFRPKKPVRKMDLAIIVQAMASRYPELNYTDETELPPDVFPEHFAAEPIRDALRLGVLDLDADGQFHAGRKLSGEELIMAVEKLGEFIDQLAYNEF